jgi:uncharacterized protein
MRSKAIEDDFSINGPGFCKGYNMEKLEINKQWKASQFNEYLGELKENSWVIYNNLSGAMVELNKRIYDAVSNNRIEEITNPSIQNSLQHGKLIVDRNLEEIENLKKMKEDMQASALVLGFQVLPSSFCNFNCTYCYEKHVNNGVMPKSVMVSLIDFIKRKMKPTTRYFNISYFGTEPLTAPKQIDYLSNAFLELGEKNNIKTSQFIVTNGYLLTKKNIEMLLKNEINSCQITIDGPESVHNNRRMLRNGGGTWRRIMDNVKIAISKGMDVKVRMNIDKTNIGSIEEFLQVLDKEDILKKVEIFIGIVTTFGNVCKSVEDHLLTIPKVTQILHQREIEEMINKSKRKLTRIMPDFFGCVATSKNSFIIAAHGEIYKCSKTIGDNHELCGNISDFDDNNPNFKKWGDVDNLNFEKCKLCSMVPLCKGCGCAFDALIKNKDISNCDQKKEHSFYLEKLKNLYLQKINEKGGQHGRPN